jgi:hypothetical protein
MPASIPTPSVWARATFSGPSVNGAAGGAS